MKKKRADLIQQLVDEKHYTKKSATELVDDFVDIVLENLRNGDVVSLHGFGTFDILFREARSCPNPQTGEKVDIPPHLIPRFYPGTKMRAVVKMWEDDARRGLA